MPSRCRPPTLRLSPSGCRFWPAAARPAQRRAPPASAPFSAAALPCPPFWLFAPPTASSSQLPQNLIRLQSRMLHEMRLPALCKCTRHLEKQIQRGTPARVVGKRHTGGDGTGRILGRGRETRSREGREPPRGLCCSRQTQAGSVILGAKPRRRLPGQASSAAAGGRVLRRRLSWPHGARRSPCAACAVAHLGHRNQGGGPGWL